MRKSVRRTSSFRSKTSYIQVSTRKEALCLAKSKFDPPYIGSFEIVESFQDGSTGWDEQNAQYVSRGGPDGMFGRIRVASKVHVPVQQVRIRQSVAQLGQDQIVYRLIERSSFRFAVDRRSDAYRQSIVSGCTGGGELMTARLRGLVSQGFISPSSSPWERQCCSQEGKSTPCGCASTTESSTESPSGTIFIDDILIYSRAAEELSNARPEVSGCGFALNIWWHHLYETKCQSTPTVRVFRTCSTGKSYLEEERCWVMDYHGIRQRIKDRARQEEASDVQHLKLSRWWEPWEPTERAPKEL
ncbi:hypothetical protein OSB04_005092 [Centaurea solstitialis]|uniref:Uncharacterized protein n=1 Tax=Centaurea solstitialis TaxID=347529 RepID=A0AA38TYD9_9ASTR|nr:hypothetical protein OSB04_005092 [Centaurea solstitialis]